MKKTIIGLGFGIAVLGLAACASPGTPTIAQSTPAPVTVTQAPSTVTQAPSTVTAPPAPRTTPPAATTPAPTTAPAAPTPVAPPAPTAPPRTSAAITAEYPVAQGSSTDELAIVQVILDPANNTNWGNDGTSTLHPIAAVCEINTEDSATNPYQFNCNIVFSEGFGISYWVSNTDPYGSYVATRRTHQ